MKYQVTRFGPGGIDYIIVDAETGDEAALAAYKPGTIIRGIEPAPAEADKPKRGRPALQGE